MSKTRPTIETALARVRQDPDARFAALLAASAAFSLGFLIGFLLGGTLAESAVDSPDEP